MLDEYLFYLLNEIFRMLIRKRSYIVSLYKPDFCETFSKKCCLFSDFEVKTCLWEFGWRWDCLWTLCWFDGEASGSWATPARVVGVSGFRFTQCKNLLGVATQVLDFGLFPLCWYSQINYEN